MYFSLTKNIIKTQPFFNLLQTSLTQATATVVRSRSQIVDEHLCLGRSLSWFKCSSLHEKQFFSYFLHFKKLTLPSLDCKVICNNGREEHSARLPHISVLQYLSTWQDCVVSPSILLSCCSWLVIYTDMTVQQTLHPCPQNSFFYFQY